MTATALRGAVALAAGTAAALVIAPTAIAAPAATVDHSAAYLAAQAASNSGLLQSSYEDENGETQYYDDIGLTIDGVLAMQATGTAGDQSTASAAKVIANAGGYTGAGYGELYTGATGKLLTMLASRGASTTIDGVDYLAELQEREQGNGRFTDQSAYGDYSNILGHSWVLMGLKRNGVNPSSAAVEFLLSRQCADGGFALSSTGDCTSDPDATSFAVQALDAVGGQDATIGEAAAYLKTRQLASGGVGGGTNTEAANSNSTGLAAAAFRIAGDDAALSKAQGYLDSMRFGCDAPAAIRGAVAYDAEYFASTTEPTSQLTRSTTQAILGSTDVSYADVTSAGQAAAPATLDGSTDDPGTDDPGTDDPGTDDPSTDDPSTDDGPVTGPVVETDLPTGADQGADSTLLALLAGSTLVIGAAGAVTVRRRATQS